MEKELKEKILRQIYDTTTELGFLVSMIKGLVGYEELVKHINILYFDILAAGILIQGDTGNFNNLKGSE